MNLFRCCLFILTSLAIIEPVRAGDEPAVHLTGNRTVDFFGISGDRMIPATRRDAVMQEENSGTVSADQKSPWIAAAMSLAVPGAGEVYANSPTKGAVFFAAETASWILYIVYNKKGNDQTDLYKAYANEHYSPVRYAEWLRNYIAAKSITGVDTSNLFYGQPDPSSGPPFAGLNWTRLNAIESDLGSQTAGFTHQLPYYGEQQYFELIGKYIQFIKGWDTEDLSNYNLPGVQDRYLPEHRQFLEYGEMFNQADTYYNTASSFISVVVVNHILSAIDAFWTASRYNNSLHADVRMNLEQSPIGLIPVTHARVMYEF